MIDARLQQDLKRLTKERPGIAPLSGAVAPNPIASKTAIGTATKVAEAGIASPLTETDYADRTWYATAMLTSTDGLFTLEYQLPASISFRDAAGAQVELILQDEP